MWHRTYSMTATGTTAEALWDAQTNVNEWPAMFGDLEWTKLEGPAKLGKEFHLKPKGGPKVRLTIVRCERPSAFADLSHLPLCKMTFQHTFTPTPDGVRIDLDLRMHGPLTFLWKKVIGAKQAEEFPAHVQALIAAAARR